MSAAGVSRRRDEELAATLLSKRGIKWSMLRAVARATHGMGPRWLDDAKMAFKFGIYELFQKPLSRNPSPKTR